MTILNSIRKLAHRVVFVGILTTLFLSQSWLKFADAPRPFTATYVTGFVIILPILITIVAWVASLFSGWRIFLDSKLRLLWAFSLILFSGWAILSQHWAFVPDNRIGVPQNAALQITLVSLFAIIVACRPPRLVWIMGMGVCLLLIQGVIGGLQVASQSSIGVSALGEFTLNPAQSGVSVIQSGDLRWLRPYGLLPHPNIYAGLIVFGLFGCAGLILHPNRRLQMIGSGVFVVGLWVFLLTFSRGAWGSFGLGALVSLFFVLRFYGVRKIFLVIAGVAILVGVIFLLMYRPLIASRVGAGEESIEMRSVADRIVFTEIAIDAIQTSPYIGMGAGNFPWYASDYLYRRTDYDLRGDNVHQVYLGIWSEYGLVGIILLGVTWLCALSGTVRNIWNTADERSSRIAILGAMLAFMAIGLFDHYPWTLIHTQIIWFTLMAAGLSVKSDV